MLLLLPPPEDECEEEVEADVMPLKELSRFAFSRWLACSMVEWIEETIDVEEPDIYKELEIKK